ncbi:twin-arginine translocase subunit TatC [Candidatus Contubernalis alkaliaceticus]|uniref:twin-arginine translocase subunit TatC n=1 Tax=Candidatus Contubernalis alkaliaceticus TaxID=338645 RepID=UPI001F4C2F97|nr:twin-arginine translocase subunit TatC [Candidatus Contubernalis alkalaceticus]
MGRKKKKEPVMNLTGHLDELRKRIIISVIAIVIGSIVTFMYVDLIRETIIRPAEGNLVFIGVAEAFMTNIKIAIIAGVLLAFPVILYQVWSFVLPGLDPREKKFVFVFVTASLLLFTGGVSFAFFVIIPISIKFFLGFETEGISAMISFGNYISYIAGVVFAFGMVFQMPIAVFILSKLGLISSEFLKKYRTHALVVIFILAAIITPPDVISQILMAIPMLLLYEISILVAKVTRK